MATTLQLVSGILAIKRYAIIACVAAAGLGTLYFFLTMSMLPAHADVLPEQYHAHIAASIVLTAAISGLGGINVAMIAFKIKRAKMINSTKSNTSALLGGTFSAFTPGCPACTAPLAVILGTVGGLSIFPLQGLELKLVSVGVLIFSICWIARGLKKRSCCSI